MRGGSDMRIDDETTTDILEYIEHHMGMQTLLDLFFDATKEAGTEDIAIIYDEPQETASALRRADIIANVPPDALGDEVYDCVSKPVESFAASANFWFLVIGENSLSCFHVCGVRPIGSC